jgi:CheY-like chemotaxis protein
LIIVADEWVGVLLGKLLTESGYEVHSANEARSGFAKARTLQPDCIVCDVSLPDVDG